MWIIMGWEMGWISEELRKGNSNYNIFYEKSILNNRK